MNETAPMQEAALSGGAVTILDDIDGVKEMISPPAKKLKQGVLPFKPQTKPVSSNTPTSTNTKKRKLSDTPNGLQKPPKTPKGENVKKHVQTIINAGSSKIDDGENEVSSSSEKADTHRKPSGDQSTAENSGLMDKFIHKTQLVEVSTSCKDIEFLDLTEDSNEADTSVNTQVPPHDDQNAHTTEAVVNQEQNVSINTGNSSGEENNDDLSDTSVTSQTQEKLIQKSSPEDSPSNKNSKLTSPSIQKPECSPVTPVAGIKRKRQLSSASSAKKIAEKAKREEEKERVRLEKQKEKEEKDKQRKEEKEEKEKQRKEEKEKQRLEKLKEKEEKEKQRKDEKEKKEQERLEAKLQREKLKMEEKQKKLEVSEIEKKKKEEEKKKQEDMEQQKTEVKAKEKARFHSFFKKQDKVETSKKPPEQKKLFMEFEVKAHMQLAPPKRREIDDFTIFDEKFHAQNEEKLYLDELPSTKPGVSERTWSSDKKDVEIVDESRKRMQTKFLCFHENHRPPYYGTWRKASKKIRPRYPTGKDESQLDYSVDSDDEWEEEEPGESLSNSEGEGEEDEEGGGDGGDDEEEDGFFVPHGYLSEGEGGEDEDESTPEAMKARQKAKMQIWEMEMKKKCESLKALVLGCSWWEPNMVHDPTTEKLDEYTVASIVSFPISLESIIEEKNVKVKLDAEKKSQLKPVPEEAMEDLLRLVHGNSAGLPKLTKEFRIFWQRKNRDSNDNDSFLEDYDNNQEDDMCDDKKTDNKRKNWCISKRQFEKKVREIAVYEKVGENKPAWLVKKDILDQYNSTGLPIPTEWQWITKKKKVDISPVAIKTTPTTPSALSIKQFTTNQGPLCDVPIEETKKSVQSNSVSQSENHGTPKSIVGTIKQFTQSQKPLCEQPSLTSTPSNTSNPVARVTPLKVMLTPVTPSSTATPPTNTPKRLKTQLIAPSTLFQERATGGDTNDTSSRVSGANCSAGDERIGKSAAAQPSVLSMLNKAAVESTKHNSSLSKTNKPGAVTQTPTDNNNKNKENDKLKNAYEVIEID